jgi:tetratricopeptide (TPR) repeat protein
MAQYSSLEAQMTAHPPATDLDRLVRGTLSAREKHCLVSHLLRGCPRCCGHLARHGGFDGSREPSADDYGAAIDRAIAEASRITAPRREALAALAALLAVDGEEVIRSTAKLPHLEGPSRLQALLETSRAVRYDDPQAMLRFARLARYAADRLRMRDFGRQPVADLRALAWAELANAYRVCNELDQADRAINRAVYWCHRGSKSDLLLARIADLLASLLAYQRRFPEGRELLAVVHRIHAEMGNRHLAGRALISCASFTLWEGSPRQALPIMRRGFDLLDPDRDPKLLVRTAWDMVWVLAELGHYRAARRLLWRSRTAFSDVVLPHRLRWLEGRILAGLSDFPRAEAAFRQARAGFVDLGQVYPAALVGLDLAALWARQGRVSEVANLAQEMIVTFRALRIAREAVASLLVLKRACQYRGGRVLQVIEIATDLLQHLERQPARPRSYSGSPPSGSPSSS